MLRIIAGKAGSIRIATPPGTDTRPTSDMVRESMFNILSPYVPGARVLDLFSGSGALGIEALSRGAKSAIFIEKSRQCCKIISENLNFTGLTDNASVICGDVLNCIQNLSGMQFDMVLMDPPYGKGLIDKAFEIMLQHIDLFSENCIIAAETSSNELLPAQNNIIQFKMRKYGKTILSFYKYADTNYSV